MPRAACVFSAVRLPSENLPLGADMDLNVAVGELKRRSPELILDFTARTGECVLVRAE